VASFVSIVSTGERVRLRRFEDRDAAALFALYADADVMRYWNHAPWTSMAQAKAAIAEARADYVSGASLHCAIEHLATGVVIGSCALYAFQREHAIASVGYMLAKEHWGRGYVREALELLLGFGFEVDGLNRIEAEVSRHNTGSRAALVRLGFLHEGRMRERWIVAGEKHDTVAYALLRDDWHTRRQRPAEAIAPVE
jgi:RimJ/RimL family protein N-acetyltransferase